MISLRYFFLFLSFLLFSSIGLATPAGLTYQGRLVKDDIPVTGAVTLTLQVTSPNSDLCVLFEETHSLTLAASDSGTFSVKIGGGTRTSNDKGLSLINIFSNRGSTVSGLTCLGSSATTYTPNSGDSRYVYATFVSAGDTVAFAPYVIQSVPYALEAERLNGKTSSEYLQVSTDTTQAKLDTLMASSTYTELNALAGGTSAKYLQSSSTAGTTIPSVSSAPGSPVAGQIWYDSVANQIKFYNGSAVQIITPTSGSGNVSASGTITAATGSFTNMRVYNGSNYIQFVAPSLAGNFSYTLPSSYGTNGYVLQTDGAGTLSWAPGNSSSFVNSGNSFGAAATLGTNDSYKLNFETNNATAMTIDTSQRVGIGTTTPGYKLDVVGDVNVSGNFKVNGVNISTGSGTVTNVSSANADIAVATGTTTPVLTLNSGTGANQIVKLDGSAKLPAVDGSLLTGITASQVSGVIPVAQGGTNSSTALNNNRLMISLGGAIVESAAMTDGQVVVGKTGSAPQLVTMTGDTTISNTGAVTIANSAVNATAKHFANPGTSYLLATDATTGATLTPFSCPLGQVLNWTASGWGCATTSALTPLTTKGDLLVSNGTSNQRLPAGTDNYVLTADSSQANGLKWAAASSSQWTTTGSDIYYTTGKVGIGTTSPSAVLEVAANSSSSPMRTSRTNNSTQGLGFAMMPTGTLSSGNPAWVSGVRAGLADYSISTYDGTTTTDRLYITTAGNIGIGTTSPGVALDIQNSSASSFVFNTGFGSGNAGFFIGRSARGTQASPTASQSGDNLGAFGTRGYGATAFSSGSRAAITGVAAENWTDTAQGTYLTFSTTPVGATTLTERMRLDSTGNVGIGTTSPGATLDVQKTDTSTSGTTYGLRIAPTYNQTSSTAANTDLLVNRTQTSVGTGTQNVIDLQVGGTSVFAINSAGNITPTGNLTWSGNNKTITMNGSSTSMTGNGFSSSSGTTTGYHFTASGGAYTSGGSFSGASSSNSFTGYLFKGVYSGTSSGNVANFSISNASASGTTLKVSNSGTGYIAIFTGSSNVGIGTTSPSYKLDVAGDINTSTCFRIGATTVSGTCTSDERLKEDIQDYKAGLSDLLNIKLHTYKFNGLGEMPKTGETAVGVIAQEVEKTNPELVKTRMVKMHPDDKENTEIKVVDYSKFSYMLINAVKELYVKWFDDHQELQNLKIDNIQMKKQIRSLASENEKKSQEIQSLKSYLCQKDPKASICHE